MSGMRDKASDSPAFRPGPSWTGSGQDHVAPAPSFEDLLLAVGATRNRDAFIRLFEYFAPRVKSFLMKGGMAPDAADELAQETMLSVWDRADSFNPARAAASTWIFTIARNKRIDALRKRKMPEVELDDPLLVDADAPLPDDIIHRDQETRIVADAIRALPPEQAELIQKAYFEEKTHSDIAAETHLPLGTVKSRIRLALDRMRQTVGQAA